MKNHREIELSHQVTYWTGNTAADKTFAKQARIEGQHIDIAFELPAELERLEDVRTLLREAFANGEAAKARAFRLAIGFET